MNMADRIASRIRWRKRLTVAALILAVVMTLLLLGDFHYYNGLEEKGFGLDLHPLIIFGILIAEGIAAVAIYSRAENSVEALLENDLDPKLYYDVKRALLGHDAYVVAKTVIDLNVSYYLGDHASCVRFSQDAIHASGEPDKLLGYSFLGMSAYLLGDKKTLDEALHKTKRLLEWTKLDLRSPLRADFDRRASILEMLSACMGNDTERAVSFANALETVPVRTTPIERANTLYLRSIVYESAHEKKKAAECSKRCIAYGGKCFFSESDNTAENQ